MKNGKKWLNILLLAVAFMAYSCIDVDARNCVGDAEVRRVTGFSSSIDIHAKTITITVNSGRYKVNSFTNGLSSYPVFSNPPCNGWNSCGQIVDRNNPLVLHLNDQFPDNSQYNIDFEIIDNPSTCNVVGGHYYFRGYAISPAPMNANGGTTSRNVHYDGICKVIRYESGYESYKNKFDPSIWDMLEDNKANEAEAKASYSSYVSTACKENLNKMTEVQLDESSIISYIKTAVKTFYYYRQAKKLGSSGWGTEFTDACSRDGNVKLYYTGQHTNWDLSISSSGGNGQNTTNGNFTTTDSFGDICATNYGDFSDGMKTKIAGLNGGGGGSYSFGSSANGYTCNATCNGDSCTNLQMYVDGKYNLTANQKTFTAVHVDEYPVTYTYNDLYCDDDSHTETRIACRRVCQENLTLSYGPPVASKAGLCFEYQVKVESKVECHPEPNPDGIPPKFPVCIPYPQCTDSGGTTRDQAGPNQQYTSCINSCDGGKYTKKCSEKCYNQVYKNSKSIIKSSSNNNNAKLKKISDGSGYTCSGGTISWSGGGLGTYYSGSNRTLSSQNAYNQLGNGFIAQDGFLKAVDADGNVCQDDCKWVDSCPGQTHYLNASDAESDFSRNMGLYEAEMVKCSAGASCEQSSSTIKISVDYSTNGWGTVQTIDFPYSTPDAKFSFANSINGEVTVRDGGTSVGDHILYNTGDGYKGYSGCYESTSAKDNYMQHWSFPGSWINPKSGEISYVDRSGDNWVTETDKFCIPLNVSDVNQKWWNYYYAHFYNTKIKNASNSANESVSSMQCVDKMFTSDASATVEHYNIHASTQGFGYFNWNLTVSCFYALNSKGTTSTGGKDIKCEMDHDYRVRPVDLGDMFPTTDGNGHTTTYGRAPGFNWSVYARNDFKNPNYTSVPEYYVQNIQNIINDSNGKGYANYYSKEYLDYEFYLDTDTLNSIRREFKKLNGNNSVYTNLNDDSSTVDMTNITNGVYHYTSKLFRVSGTLAGSVGVGHKGSKGAIPHTDALKCNNMINYTKKECSKVVSQVGGDINE